MQEKHSKKLMASRVIASSAGLALNFTVILILTAQLGCSHPVAANVSSPKAVDTKLHEAIRGDADKLAKICARQLAFGKARKADAAWFQQASKERLEDWKRGAELGYPEAEFLLVNCMTLLGEDHDGRMRRLRKAADGGYAVAQFGLGLKRLEIAKNKEEERKAVHLLLKAAKQGYAPAQYRLGMCYFFSVGVNKNNTEAIQWLRKSAKQGDAPAEYALALAYIAGKGVPRNVKQGIHWLRKAESQEYPEAVAYIAKCKKAIGSLGKQGGNNVHRHYSKSYRYNNSRGSDRDIYKMDSYQQMQEMEYRQREDKMFERKF